MVESSSRSGESGLVQNSGWVRAVEQPREVGGGGVDDRGAERGADRAGRALQLCDRLAAGVVSRSSGPNSVVTARTS
ncbi:hypothetical protein [Actinophytocola sp.]|uniref:hypothetical protein n=1 Tax=Actinophytocola sp. TaxID=1872138 RepID=UPI00389AE399